MLRLRSQEDSLVQSSFSKYCDDGSDFLALENGWKWVMVAEGSSRQEGIAMGHCGNGAGKMGDVLYSLREPVPKKNKLLWRPHLTFICNKNGFFGEMKGRANSKPSQYTMNSSHNFSCIMNFEESREVATSENNFALSGSPPNK